MNPLFSRPTSFRSAHPLGLIAALLSGGAVSAQEATRQPETVRPPLSAVEWLDRDSALPAAIPAPAPAPQRPPAATGTEPAVAQSGATPEVDVRPLDAPSVSAVGLLPPHVTGFPLTLWRGSDPVRQAELLTETDTDGMPALQALLFSLLLAEADPPATAQGEALLVARLDRLIAQGATAPALALVEQVGHESPALFRRWFDLMLLTGETDRACAALADMPQMLEDIDARVYCLTLTGQWDAAVTTLEAARLLGDLDTREAELLTLFIDPELAEEMAPPRIPEAGMTPLTYRMLQALGDPPPINRLPRAFAALALTGDVGWRAQIEAAERLARAGAVPANQLIGIYSERDPAASGGIWDRVDAVQRLDTALAAGDVAAVSTALPSVWAQARAAGLAVPFATLFAERLATLPLEGRAAAIARDFLFLSPLYETAGAAFGGSGASAAQRFMAGLATGAPEASAAPEARAAAIASAFAPQEPPAELREMVRGDRLGEAILLAMRDTLRGAEGDQVALTRGLSRLRALGLEDTARRAALQMMILGQAS